MTRYIFFFLLFVALFFSDLQAQLLNVERIRSDADTTGWQGDIGFDFSLNRLNDKVFKFQNSTNISYNTSQHSYLFLTNLELVNVDEASLVSSGYFHLRSLFIRDQTFSPELFIQYQYNENLSLNKEPVKIGLKV